MGSGIIIREFAEKDAPNVKKFLEGLAVETIVKRFLIKNPHFDLYLHQMRRNRSILALDDATVVGMCDFLNSEDLPDLALVVADSYHRRGIGRLLVNEAANLAKISGCKGFHFDVAKDNSVLFNFFNKLVIANDCKTEFLCTNQGIASYNVYF